MNTTEKNNLLQQAICCSGNYAKDVAELLLAGDKCAESEFEKLALLVSAIEALDCYNAPLEVENCVPTTGDPLADPVESIFSISIPCATAMTVPSTMSFSGLGGVSAFNITVNINNPGDNDLQQKFVNDVIPQLPAGFTATLYSGDCTGGTPEVYLLTGPCDITGYTLDYFLNPEITSTQIVATQQQAGVCNETVLTCTTTTTEYNNCLTETEADNIAEIITDICDICDCTNN